MKLLKLKWFNYFLLVTLLNITLHICYLYMLLQAHDTLDHTANNIYSFEQVGNIIIVSIQQKMVAQLLSAGCFIIPDGFHRDFGAWKF